MLKKGMSISDIENELDGKGDFVQIDSMTRFLKEDLLFDTKKYVSIRLADIYEKRAMFAEAAKIYELIGEFSKNYSEQMKYYLRATEIFIKAGDIEKADECLRKAIKETTGRQKADILSSMKNLYMHQAEKYEEDKRRSHAVKLYEKLLVMDLSEEEREKIKKKLLELYETLGKVREYYMLKGGHEKV